MYRITKIGLQNYRIFDDSKMHDLAIAPITIITGANSSGKSSVFKALMLLEENRKQNNLFKLDFSGFKHLLGSFDSIRHQSDNDLIDFALSFDEQNKKKEIKLYLSFRRQNKDLGILQSCEITLDNVPIIKFEIQCSGLYKTLIDFKPFLDYTFSFSEFYDEQVLKNIVDNNSPIRDLLENQIDSDIQRERDNLLQKEKENLIQQKRKEINDKQNLLQQKKESAINEQEKEDLTEEINKLEEEYNQYEEGISKGDSDFEEDFTTKTKNIIDEKIKSITDIDIDVYKQKALLDLKRVITDNQLKKIDKISADVEFPFFENIKKISIEYLIKHIVNYNEEQPSLADLLNLSGLENGSGLTMPYEAFSELQEKDTYKKIYSNLIGRFLDLLENIELPFQHLPAVRGKQERIITFSNQNDILENAVLDLLQKNYTPHTTSPDKAQQFIRKWLSKNLGFQIGYDIKIEIIDGSSIILKILSDEKDTTGRNLADFGLGISQLLPIILTCATSEPNTLICIEEPETNLHPKFQSMLVEIFVDAHKTFKVQFALETHSEYLIMKLQELVLENSIDKELNHNDVIIYYFKEGNVLSTGLDEFGNIKDESIFGEGFFDVVPNLRGSLLQKQIKKSIKPIFVEGKTDKLILDKAIKIFAEKDLKDVSLHTDTTNTGSGVNGIKDIILNWIHDRESQNSKALAIVDHDTPAIEMKKDLECKINNDPKYPKYIDFIQQKQIKIIFLSKPAWLISLYQKGVFESNYHFNYSLEHLFPEYWEYAESKNWLKDREDKIRLKNPPNVTEIDYLKNQGLDEIVLRLLFKKVDNLKKVKFAKYICSQMDNSDKWKDLKNLVKQIEAFFS